MDLTGSGQSPMAGYCKNPGNENFRFHTSEEFFGSSVTIIPVL
jgi:hypothetical protein